MIRLSIATVLGFCAAFVIAAKLGGALGGGVLAGFTLGAGMSGIGAVYQRHMLRFRPELAMAATTVSFLAKLVALLVGALAFRYIETAAARADWRAFLVAFAAAVAIVLPLGVLDATSGKGRRQGDAVSSERMEPKEA